MKLLNSDQSILRMIIDRKKFWGSTYNICLNGGNGSLQTLKQYVLGNFIFK